MVVTESPIGICCGAGMFTKMYQAVGHAVHAYNHSTCEAETKSTLSFKPAWVTNEF